MRIIDRYVIREVLWPFVIGLVIFTFILIIPFLIPLAEKFISKGVPTMVVVQIMATLLPQALGLTIPMSLLLGLLVAFGRLSTDREFVAMQACGVSLIRLLRPVALLSIAAWAATSYVLLVSVPNANQAYREMTFNIVAERAEGEVRPRVFFEDFPELVLYVREVPQAGGWNGVFMADNRAGQTPAIYLARHGRVAIDRKQRTVQMILQDGTRHTADAAGKYEVFRFKDLILTVNPDRVFPRTGPARGEREMSIAELRTRAAQLEREGNSPHNPLMEIHKKFSIPFACFVFGLIGLALGASNRRGGKLASFVLGIGVIFVYYVLLWLGQSMAKGHLVPAWLGVWLPNIGLGIFGALLFTWRDRAADQPIRIPLPSFAGLRWTGSPAASVADTATRRRVAVTLRIPQVQLPRPGILDRYIGLSYLRVLALSFVALMGLFYIATFLDHSDKVFKGQATWGMLLKYFWYQTPEYVYYVIPLAVLLASLVTIGLLTKNSELIVMKACGISLYRVSVPLLLCAAIGGLVLFALEETILGPWTRQAYAIRHVMRGGSPQTFDVLNRQWIVGSDGDIYHYVYFDPRMRQLNGLSIYEFSSEMRQLTRRVYAERAIYVGSRPGADADAWQAEQGWVRDFTEGGETRTFAPFAQTTLALEPVAYFATERPEPEYMSYSQLRRYTDQLRASGFDVIEQQVALERKVSFPFVTLIMTLIAVPFAVTTGRRGAMYGIGAGIVLAVVYWFTISIFAALGSGGLIAPALAAWAPNLLFGAAAAFLLLTART
jgi:LPS export ABC transporter permease LptG/LPS export ABC transporter permease LptF